MRITYALGAFQLQTVSYIHVNDKFQNMTV